MEIRLSFHDDTPANRIYPQGYWAAEAVNQRGTTDFDGVGATPLDAVIRLASQMYQYHLDREQNQ